jgi:hypothetical protein
MQLSNFLSKIYTDKGNYGNVVSVASYYDKEIIVNEEQEYFVDGIKLEQKFENLEEVKAYIDIQEEAFKTKVELYENISDTKVASIIRKYTDTKITNQLVEHYIQTASSKCFTIDPIILEMRQSNKLDSEIDGKIVFRLNDGKQIALSEQTLEKIANLLNNLELKDQTIGYMRESRDNFLSVMRLL